jgi:hypothetical protein
LLLRANERKSRVEPVKFGAEAKVVDIIGLLPENAIVLCG